MRSKTSPVVLRFLEGKTRPQQTIHSPYYLAPLTCFLNHICSKYRGDKWDAFFSVLPSSLVNHINGNAIYNLTHPLFNRLVTQLELESTTIANSIPYDYRISQIVEECQTSVKPSFPLSGSGVDPAPALSDKFFELSEQFDLDDIIREVPVIGNYASTNMLTSYLDDRETVIHGAKLRSFWDDSKVGVS
jgi:hypothetical protein